MGDGPSGHSQVSAALYATAATSVVLSLLKQHGTDLSDQETNIQTLMVGIGYVTPSIWRLGRAIMEKWFAPKVEPSTQTQEKPK